MCLASIPCVRPTLFRRFLCRAAPSTPNRSRRQKWNFDSRSSLTVRWLSSSKYYRTRQVVFERKQSRVASKSVRFAVSSPSYFYVSEKWIRTITGSDLIFNWMATTIMMHQTIMSIPQLRLPFLSLSISSNRTIMPPSSRPTRSVVVATL